MIETILLIIVVACITWVFTWYWQVLPRDRFPDSYYKVVRSNGFQTIERK